ncbi:nuclear pore complex protein Nup93, partial [Lecanoromycetidae sp. Uapishka_2]
MSSIFNQSKPASSLFGNPATSAQSQPAQTTSLFGNTTTLQPQQSSTNIFAHLGTSKPQEHSLFSNLGGEQKANPSPTLGTSQSQQQINSGSGGGLFGSTQPAPSNLLGATNNATTSQASGTSIFAPQLPPQQNNPLGQTAQGQQPQQDGQQLQGPDKARQPAYFDNLLERGRKRTHDADGGAGLRDLPSLQLGLGDIAKRVRELGGVGAQAPIERASDSRAHYLLAASGINPGTTRRDLESLALHSSASRSLPQVPDWDPDTHKYVEQLQQQSTLKMISEGLERAQRNFDAYLEENVDINWEFQRKKIYEHFGLTPKAGDASYDYTSSPGEKGSFGKSAKRGRSTNKTGSGKSTLNRSIFGPSSLQKSVIGTPGVGSGNATLFADVAEKNGITPAVPDDRFFRERQRKYTEKVQALNRARLNESPFPLMQEFKDVECHADGDSPRQIQDAYKALMDIVGEHKAKQRQFASEYLDEAPNSAKATKLRKRILDGSRKCLETAFFEQLESLVAKNPKEANIGGVPTTINKVRAYIRIRAARRDLTPDGTELRMIDDDYCWALVFFLLRSGLEKEAAEYVVSNQTAFKTIDRNLVTYITGFASSPDRRLERKVQDHINREYSKQTRVAPDNQTDPYQLACYKIIGRCELSKRIIDSISQGVDDWIWLQFSIAREVNRVEESAGDVFGLEEVRETIREIGERHFAKGAEGMGGYGTFFFLQILGGMFEQAVSYLYSYSYVAAVHFAIALDYYGLLRVSDFSTTETELRRYFFLKASNNCIDCLLVTFNTKELPQISFGRMIGYYTRDFRSANVEAAVDYLTLICLNASLPGAMGKSQSSLCHEALRELVLETREFAQLLGDIRYDGTRLKGAIERRLPLIALKDQEDFLKTITIQAASVADDNGRITDAVLLYHLAEDYDSVISIINRALSEAIAIDIGQEQMRLQPLKPRAIAQQEQSQQQQQPDGSSLSLTSSVDDPAVLARNMITLYNANALYFQKIRPTNRETCGILLRMSEAKDKVAAGQWSEAIDTIESLNLLPLKAKASVPTIRASATAFNALPPTISRNIGPLLLWTIACIGQQRELLASRQYGGGEGGTNKEISDELLGSARDLMVFAGLVKYRLGDKVWEAVCGVGGDVGVY